MEESNEHNDLLIKWLNNELSDSEKAAFEQSEDFVKYSSIINEVDQWKVPVLDLEKSYEKLKANRTITRKITWYQQPAMRWAAVIAVIATVFIYFFTSSDTVTIETGIAETRNVILPDKSKIIVKPNSSISYRKKTFIEKRKIKQKGTAYYDVEEGKSFTVEFGESSLEVLGTTFEIKSTPEFSSVECYTGHVRVTSDKGQFDLTRKKGVNLSDIAEEYNFEHEWSLELTRFKSTPLKEVFKSIENEFVVTIKTGQVDLERKFTGSYSNEDLKTALKMVCTPMNIKYEINGQIVTLQ